MPFINRPALLARRAKAFRRMISIGSNVDLLRIASITRFRLHFSWARWNIALLWIACSFVRNRFIGRRMMYILGTLLIRWLFFALRPVDALMRIGHVSIHRLITSQDIPPASVRPEVTDRQRGTWTYAARSAWFPRKPVQLRNEERHWMDRISNCSLGTRWTIRGLLVFRKR